MNVRFFMVSGDLAIARSLRPCRVPASVQAYRTRVMSSNENPHSSSTTTHVSVEDFPEPLTVLHYTSSEREDGQPTTYYLLGTAHVSSQSCEDARSLIERTRPQVVMLELCAERKALLSDQPAKEPNLAAALAEVRAGRSTPFQAIYGWLLSTISKSLEVTPGEEFRVALKAANRVGAQVVLGDRLVSVTMARLWEALSGWEKVRLLAHLSWAGLSMLEAEAMKAEIESLKETDALTEAIREFGKAFPGLIRPLLTERDLYMTCVLRRLAAHATTVVAVVGAGHLPGIREHWEDEIDVEALMTVPDPRERRRRRLVRLAVFSGTALAIGLGIRFALKRHAAS